MLSKMLTKLENPQRRKELSPGETLRKAGFAEGMTLCDIGAGTGLFLFEAARISREAVFALEINPELIQFMEKRKAEQGIANAIIRQVENEKLPVEDHCCDMVLLVTVFHELADKETMLREIRRILKKPGKLFIIEFYYNETPMGPPLGHRISEELLENICEAEGFVKGQKFSLGDNFYGIEFMAET